MAAPLCTFQPSLANVLDPTPNDCYFQYDDYLAAGLLAVIYVFARMILDRTVFQVRHWLHTSAPDHPTTTAPRHPARRPHQGAKARQGQR